MLSPDIPLFWWLLMRGFSSHQKRRKLKMDPKIITYQDLWVYYSDKVTERLGNKATGLLKVTKSHIALIHHYCGKDWGSAVGTELLSADEFGLFLRSLEKKVGAATIASVKSKLGRVRESYLGLSLKQNLADGSFGACVGYLVKNVAKTITEVAAAAGMPTVTLSKWILGETQPQADNLGRVAALEQYFSLPKGTLRNKLGTVVFGEKTTRLLNRKDFGHSDLSRKLKALPYAYKFPGWPEQAKLEFEELYRFYTDQILSGANAGLNRNVDQTWRIKYGKCNSRNRIQQTLERFYGFLVLPKDAADPALRGLDVKPERLSIALVTNPKLIDAYIRFLAARHEGVVTTGSEQVLKNARAFISSPFGYLRQRPDIGRRYCDLSAAGELIPVDQTSSWPERWETLCNQNHHQVQMMLKSTQFKPFKDVLEPTRVITDSSDIPGEIKKIIHAARAHAEQSGLHSWEQARRYRDFMIVLFHFLFELRCEHYSHLELGRHLFKRDGRWVIKLYAQDFKVPKSISNAEYILDLPADVSRFVETYVEKYRPELMHPESKYFFLASCNCNADHRSGIGLNDRYISKNFRDSMILFSSSSTGFSSHSVRKVVSTAFGCLELRKQDALRGAAGLAGHSVGVSKKHYMVWNSMQESFYLLVRHYQATGILETPAEILAQLAEDDELKRLRDQVKRLMEVNTLLMSGAALPSMKKVS
jgi:hypothetical protein